MNIVSIKTISLNGILNEFLKVMAFIKKDFKVSTSYKMQFVFQFLQIFFSISLIYFIGEMLADTGSTKCIEKYGGNYFSFALIGLAVNSFLRAGLVSITNDIRQVMNQGTLEAMCATPIDYTWLLFCASTWQFLFEAIRVVCYYLMGIVMFGLRLEHANWLPALLVLVLTAPIFMMLGVCSCSILVVVKRGDPLNWIFSTVGALLAGTMFPVSVFPGWLRTLSTLFPLTHSLEAMRKALLLGATYGQIKEHLLILFAFTVLLIPITFGISRWCMNHAKKNGTISMH